MNRRTAIKQFFILSGGIWLAASCSGNAQSTSIVLNQIKLNAKDEALLASLVDTLIPMTDSPGGKDLNLHLFVMKMVDDCHPQVEQEAFIAGLQAVHKMNKTSESDLLAYLQKLAADDVFLSVLKRRTIQGYLNSSYVMKNKLIYELVPGHYDGAVKVQG